MSTKNLAEKKIKIKVDEDIFLRVLTLNDVARPYVEWLNDYEVIKFTEQKYFKNTLENTKNFVSQKYNSGNDLLFGIFFDNTHVGNIKLGPIKFDHMSADVSYFIGEKKFWGRGIASKCVKTIVQLAVTDLGLKKIKLLTSNPKKVVGLDGYGLEIVETVSLNVEPNPINEAYLKTKKEKLGHKIDNV